MNEWIQLTIPLDFDRIDTNQREERNATIQNNRN